MHDLLKNLGQKDKYDNRPIIESEPEDDVEVFLDGMIWVFSKIQGRFHARGNSCAAPPTAHQ